MVKIKWLGHASFEITFENKVVLIDPFLTNNPKAAVKPDQLEKADIIIVTHDHFDHFSDAVEIAKRLNSKIVGVYETVNKASEQGVQNVVGLNIGGTAKVDDLTITLTPAIHSGTSNPSGAIVSDGKVSVYHAGDTALFGDMKLIGQIYKPRVALLPIGGFYTMGPLEAAIATSLIKPKVVIPHHYGTFPLIEQDPKEFAKLVRRKAKGVKVVILNPGESYEL